MNDEHALDMSTAPHVKRVWDALTGRYVIIPVTSSILSNRKE